MQPLRLLHFVDNTFLLHAYHTALLVPKLFINIVIGLTKIKNIGTGQYIEEQINLGLTKVKTNF